MLALWSAPFEKFLECKRVEWSMKAAKAMKTSSRKLAYFMSWLSARIDKCYRNAGEIASLKSVVPGDAEPGNTEDNLRQRKGRRESGKKWYRIINVSA